MVSSDGAAQASNAYPLSRVAVALLGYDTVVAGSAAAGRIVKAARIGASMATATPKGHQFMLSYCDSAHFTGVHFGVHIVTGPVPYARKRRGGFT